MQGQVMSVAGGAGRDAAHIQYETQRPQEAFGSRPRVHTVVHGQWRLSIYLGKCRNELFDLENDPGEMTNLWDSEEITIFPFANAISPTAGSRLSGHILPATSFRPHMKRTMLCRHRPSKTMRRW